MKLPWAKRVVKDCEGQEIAEAAFVLPILFLLLIAIYWFGRAYNIYSTINHAAREGARVAAAPSACTSCGASTVNTSQVETAVTQALQASHIDISAIQAYSPSTTPCPGILPTNACTITGSKVTVCQGIELNAANVTSLNVPPLCGVSVSFQYPFNFSIPFTSVSNITLKANVLMQEEN